MLFDIDPFSLVSIIFLIALYWWACWRLGRRPTRYQAFFFCMFILMLLVSVGPLDRLAYHRAFWAHMAADSIQAFLVPALFLLSLPDWMARPVVMSRYVEPVARFFSKPIVAFFTFTAVFCLAHDPPIFERMCYSANWQAAVHLGFLLAGVIMWWPLLSPMPEFPRLSYPVQILYLFLLLIPMTAVAAPITLSYGVIYSWYAVSPHPFGLSPMDDQIIGGLVMWIGVAMLLITAATLIFFRWARSDEIEEPPLNFRRQSDLRVLHRPGKVRA
jgi:putative membrane protein